MDWNQAQSMARGGHVVRREDWPDHKLVREHGGDLVVTDERGFSEPFYPSAEDREATDWAKKLEGDDHAAAKPAKAKSSLKSKFGLGSGAKVEGEER